MKIGERFTDNGREFEVIGFDYDKRPVSRFVGLATKKVEEVAVEQIELPLDEPVPKKRGGRKPKVD